MRADVTPTDTLEEIWVRDIVDLVCGHTTLAAAQAESLLAARHEGVARMFKPLIGSYDADKLAKNWIRQDRDAIEEVATHSRYGRPYA